jgi:hypothetical protein
MEEDGGKLAWRLESGQQAGIADDGAAMNMVKLRAETAPMATRAAPPIRAKLKIGPVDDPLEREADRIADAVVRGGPVGAIGGGAAHETQRKCAGCAVEEEKTPRRKIAGRNAATSVHAASAPKVTSAVASGGVPLTPAQRAYFEPRFGCDLSGIRVHTSDKAAASAQGINARAFTLGSDIAFAHGEYEPETHAGRHLIAHELAHVAQQSNSGRLALQRQPKDSPWSDWWPPDFKPICPECPIEPPSTKDVAEGICKLDPSNPICKFYHLEPPPSSKTLCPPGFHGSTSSSYKDQCCKDGQPESDKNCCPKDRVGDGRCCVVGEFAEGGLCKKVGTIDIGKICIPPGRKSPSGECCNPPKVPGIWGCVDAPSSAPSKPLIVDSFVDRFTILFKQGQPREGQSFEDSLASGRDELDKAIAVLKADLSTGALLVANASNEGKAGQNLDLTDRRLAAVQTELKEVNWKVRDPMPSMQDTSGCRGSWGAYSCGTKNADPKAIQEGDRNVIIRLFRPTEIKLSTPRPWPLKRWTIPTGPF